MASPAYPCAFDTIIRNVTVVDGTDNASYIADIGIKDDLIAAIGNLRDSNSISHIDGESLYLAPGFIDVHTHDDLQVIQSPSMLPKISQGITTVITGNCGISATPANYSDQTRVAEPLNLLGSPSAFVYPELKDYAQAVRHAQPAINVATLVGHTTLRANHVTELDSPADSLAIDAMCRQLEIAMEQGALGLSTGLAYPNAINAPTDEIKALAQVVSKYDGIYTTHLRTEFADIHLAIDEAFDIGRSCDLPVVISHLKCAGVDNWGRSSEIINQINEYSEKHELAFDCYPYTASSSNLDLGQVTDEIDIHITYSHSHPDMNNKPLAAIAHEWKLSLHEAASELIPAGAVYHCMTESDVDNFIVHPLCMIGSDGLPCDPHPHPRLWGSFPRVIAHYHKSKNLFSLEKAIQKMTALSSDRFALNKRGKIAIGYFADLVLFDLNDISDKASFTNPKQLSSGIKKVWVNGQLSYTDNKVTTVGAGRFLQKQHRGSK